MKKVLVVMALALALTGIAGQASAATTGTITVTVSLVEEIAVLLDNNTWTIGSIALSGSNALATVKATNDGNVAIDLKIKGANGAGGWTIGTPAASNVFEVALTSPAIKLSTTDQVLASAVPATGISDFKNIDLTYNAPTADTFGGGLAQGFNITITASKTP